jgi:hypothetical protein
MPQDQTEWLLNRFPHLREVRNAVGDFSLLWSYFEATHFKKDADASLIVDKVQALAKHDPWNPKLFDEEFDYYSSRYFSRGKPTGHFVSLGLKSKEKVAEAALAGKDDDPVNKIAAVFLVIYRLRNNFFFTARNGTMRFWGSSGTSK